MSRYPLTGELVVDLSSGIGGGYCAKVLADGGADVIKVETLAGDPLRRWSASQAPIAADDDGALFKFLRASQRSVAVDPASSVAIEQLRSLIRQADGVIWSAGSELAAHPSFSVEAIHELAPHATVTAISPFGLHGSWSDRASTEATLQGWSGGAGQRGTLDRPPLLVGGRMGDWETGMVAALAYLISRHRRVAIGTGEIVDVSALDAQCLTMIVHPVTWFDMAGFPMRTHRMANLPGIHPARDGFVGFMCVTGQQWLDFAAMVERPDWAADESLLKFVTRTERYDELSEVIEAWTSARTVGAIVELAVAMRVPVAPVNNGQTVLAEDHLLERGWFVENPRGSFLQPDVPYTLSGSAQRRPPGPAPRLGEHTDSVFSEHRADRTDGPKVVVDKPAPRPFAGLRVVDFTANWAGPIITHVLGMLGADVIKIESAVRPDALRFNTVKGMQAEDYWEWSPIFHGTNTSKRGLTLDMSQPAGREVARRLIAGADVVVENSSPRVLPGWGLTTEVVHDLNPRCIFLRAPAYGLDGPWSERVGYTQTIEMSAGLAWLTGFADGPPVVPNAPCDPVAGVHALIALLLALEHRRVTGEASMVEVPMIGGALNLAAEQIVEFSAYGAVLQRDGNRSPAAAPQGCYRSADHDLPEDQGRWVVISIETDDQWSALRRGLGDPAWTADPELADLAGRHRAHDRIDRELDAWCAGRTADMILDALWPLGVPVAKMLLGYEQAQVQPLIERGWFQRLDHPLTGPTTYSGFPAIFSAGPSPADLHTSLPPGLGQHNREILLELGLDGADIDALERDGVIGTRPGMATAW
ncbi:MAG: caib/baif family protein [Pseudonocardiales bacterium]|nr:caib/baif family protein [Pseudonocardiales bacterium]